MIKDFNSKNSLKIFFSYYKPHMKLFVFDMICATLLSAIDVAFPMISRFTINTIIPEGNFRLFALLIISLVLVYILRRCLNSFICYWGHVFGNRVECDMRHDVFTHIENQSFSFFDTHLTGRIMARATTDLFEVTELAHHGPEDVLISVLTLLGSFFLLLHIKWELALIVFLFIPVIILVVTTSRSSLTISSRKVKEKTSEINASLESSISGIRVTKVFTNEKFEEQRLDESNKEFSKAKCKYYKEMSRFHVNIDFFNNILNVIVLGVGGYFIIKGKMKVADLVAANLFIAAFTQPIKRISNFVEQYTTGMAGFNRFLELMRTDTGVKDSVNSVELLSSRGNISYNNVDFSYSNNIPVLKNISFTVHSGEKIALVGSSGGGKTTVCNLLPRFYEFTKGSITLDGIDIKQIKLESLRKQIGVVQQDVFLFAGSVKENIAYGKNNATDEEIITAAKRAEIHDDIIKMPNGYNTLVGERGIKLSGGQKQRISIARCFLKNPPVLILDEATSALDSATELKIQHAFDNLSQGRTTLVIAHRLSTIKNADCIMVIKDKTIVEQGTHKELLEANGQYAAFYHAQNEEQ